MSAKNVFHVMIFCFFCCAHHILQIVRIEICFQVKWTHELIMIDLISGIKLFQIVLMVHLTCDWFSNTWSSLFSCFICSIVVMLQKYLHHLNIFIRLVKGLERGHYRCLVFFSFLCSDISLASRWVLI